MAARVIKPPTAIAINFGRFMGSKVVHGVIARVATMAVQLMMRPIVEYSTFELTL
jgi:hypothetical protein